MRPSDLLLLPLVAPVDETARAAAAARQLELTKPPGSLGRLELYGNQLAAIAGVVPPPVPASAVVCIFAGDHGVVQLGVTPWPQEVTAQMVANFVAGGAAINALAASVGAAIHVVDVGVATDLSAMQGIEHARVAAGTANLADGPAMSIEQAAAAVAVGVATADRLVDSGADLLVTGEMGIGNTTPSAALISAFTGLDAEAVTGRGTGIDNAALEVKTRVVSKAVARVRGEEDPLVLLAELGGLEIAALTGFIIAGAARGVPVVIDGVICCAALLVAEQLSPSVVDRCLIGHRSTEPGASAVIAHLGVDPILDLDLRLGEGSGACLAIPIVRAAAAVLHDMRTFDEASVDGFEADAG